MLVLVLVLKFFFFWVKIETWDNFSKNTFESSLLKKSPSWTIRYWTGVLITCYSTGIACSTSYFQPCSSPAQYVARVDPPLPSMSLKPKCVSVYIKKLKKGVFTLKPHNNGSCFDSSISTHFILYEFLHSCY